MNIALDTGLSEDILNVIYSEISKIKSIESVVLFGSRAKGCYRPGSDIDLAVSGFKVTRDDVVSLSYRLNQETNLPYHFDILNIDDADKAVQEHIQRTGLQLYSRDKESN